MVKIKQFFLNKILIFRMFLIIYRRSKLLITFVMLISVIKGLLPLITAYILVFIPAVYAFDKVISSKTAYLFILYGIAYIMGDILANVESLLIIPIESNSIEVLQGRLVDKVNSFSVRFKSTHTYSKLYELTNNASNPLSIYYLIKEVPGNISLMVTIISIMLAALYLNWVLTVFCVVITIFISLLNKSCIKKLIDVNRNDSLDDRRVNELKSHLYDTNKILELKIYDATNRFIDKWKSLHSSLVRSKNKKLMKIEFYQTLLRLCSNRILLYIILAIYIIYIANDMANAVLFTNIFISLIANIYMFTMNLGAYQYVSEQYKDYFYFFDLKSEEIRTEGEEADNITVVGKDIFFSYNDEVNVLKNITFILNAGEKIAIIGENGSGKTTLANIIARLYYPKDGQLYFIDSNNHIIKDVKSSAVFQNICKYPFDLRMNIAISESKEYANNQLIIETIKDAGLNKFADESYLDKQLMNSMGGIDFSGGEWQKIGIARSMYRQKYGLVIMDEPNSALDALAETEIINNFFERNKKRTCIIITHRLSSLKHVDKIMVMDDGRIIEYGTHDDLMKYDSVYKKLLIAQQKAYII